MHSKPAVRAPAASTIDRYALYEKAVQDPDLELALLERMLRRAGRPARRLREDFSGTALLSARWVSAGPDREAVAVDRERRVHAWTRANRLTGLGAAARRLELVCGDVRRAASHPPFDAIIALNFSYQNLLTRGALRDYLTGVRGALAPGGVLMLDLFGGELVQLGLTERRRLGKGLTYVWDQGPLDPITHRIRCSIHFENSHGRRIPGGWRYDWRLWTLPEMTDLLQETGFEAIEVLWDSEPQGVEPRYRLQRRGENRRAWVAYLFARRPRALKRR